MQNVKRFAAPSCLSYSATGDVLRRFDPRATLRTALNADLDDAGPRAARDCLLVWVLGLPDDVDARRAAAAVLPELSWPDRSEFARALRSLLREVADCQAIAVQRRRRRVTH